MLISLLQTRGTLLGMLCLWLLASGFRCEQAFGHEGSNGAVYNVSVLRMDADTTRPMEATLEFREARDGETTRALMKLPVIPESDRVLIRRKHFPAGTHEIFGSFDSIELAVWKFPTIPDEGRVATFYLMGNPALDDPTRIGRRSNDTSGDWHQQEYKLEDLAGNPIDNVRVTAFNRREKTTHTLRVLDGGRLVIPEYVLYGGDAMNPRAAFFDITVFDMRSNTGCELDSSLCLDASEWMAYSQTRKLPFLNDWSQTPADVNVYQGVLMGEGDVPLRNQPFEVLAEVTDVHIMHRALSFNLVTNEAGEFCFALKNRKTDWYEKNSLCAIRLPFMQRDRGYYIIKSGRGIVVDKSKPDAPGQGQRMEQPE